MSQKATVTALPNQRAWDNAKQQSDLPGWITAAVPPDVDIRYNLRALRARARDEVQNGDHARYFLRLVEANVIGRASITVQSQARKPGGAQDITANTAIEEAWEEQSERGTWDVTGQLDRATFDRLAVRTLAQDGEVLIRIIEGWGDSSTDTGFRLQMIDPEALDIDYNTTLANGNTVRMGVEIDGYRRPTGYYLLPEPESAVSPYTRGEHVRVDAKDILHVYLPEWVWQTRGVPWMATALKRMHNLSGYEGAAVSAARASALKSMFYKQDPDNPPASLPAGYDDGTGNLNQNLEPGTIETLPAGWGIETADWSWPNTDHGEFVKACLRGIASGLGVSYNSLTSDLEGVSYSSLRQGALAERDMWTQIQAFWVSWVTKPVHRRWVAWSIGQGKILRPGNRPLDTRKIKEFSRATYQPRRWPWVDPLKDIQANREAVAMRARSISDVIREQGRDPQEVWEELAADLAALDNLGLTPESLTAAPAQKDTDKDE